MSSANAFKLDWSQILSFDKWFKPNKKLSGLPQRDRESTHRKCLDENGGSSVTIGEKISGSTGIRTHGLKNTVPVLYFKNS